MRKWLSLLVPVMVMMMVAPGGAGNVSAASRASGQTVLVNFVLDKSGSMGARRERTIQAFNAFLADQKKQAAAADGQTDFSLTLFDSVSTHPYSNVPIATVPDLTDETYKPGGSTALYDAIGTSDKQVEALNPQPDKVVFVILTDGMENSSTLYNQKQIFTTITQQRQAGWQFIFLGVDEDAYAASEGLGIADGSTMTYGTKRSAFALHDVANAIGNWRKQTNGAGASAPIAFSNKVRDRARAGVKPGSVIRGIQPGTGQINPGGVMQVAPSSNGQVSHGGKGQLLTHGGTKLRRPIRLTHAGIVSTTAGAVSAPVVALAPSPGMGRGMMTVLVISALAALAVLAGIAGLLARRKRSLAS